MSEIVTEQKDRFWLYIAGITAVLVAVVGMVKLSENEKYSPIEQQQAEEIKSLNLRVIKEY